MAVEGLDATILIETAGFVPQAGVSETPAADAGPTLEAALAAAGATDGDRSVPNTAREAGLIRDDVTLDLWVAEGSRAAPPLLHIGGPFPHFRRAARQRPAHSQQADDRGYGPGLHYRPVWRQHRGL